MEKGRYDIELFIEYWCHNRFEGSGDFRQRLENLLTEEWELSRTSVLEISDQLFNRWLPEFLHYFPVGDPMLFDFIKALAAKLVWLDEIGDMQSRGGLWGTAVAGSVGREKERGVLKYSVDIRAILSAIEMGQSRLPCKIARWLFYDLRKTLDAADETIAEAKAAKSKAKCPARAQDCFAITDSVRTSIENLLIEVGNAENTSDFDL